MIRQLIHDGDFHHGLLTAAIYRSTGNDSKMRVVLLVQKFGGPLGVTKEMLEQVATVAGAEARRTLTRLKLPSKDLQLLDTSRAAQAFGRKVAGRVPHAAMGTSPAAPNPATAAAPSSCGRLARSRW